MPFEVLEVLPDGGRRVKLKLDRRSAEEMADLKIQSGLHEGKTRAQLIIEALEWEGESIVY